MNLIALAACELYGVPPFQDHSDAPISKQREKFQVAKIVEEVEYLGPAFLNMDLILWA